MKEAISYCGLCIAEKSSADKMIRTPISKQGNKHIQQVLVEAAKLADLRSHELALVRDKELQKGNKERATLVVARKMVTHMLAVERRQQDFVSAENMVAKLWLEKPFLIKEGQKHQDSSMGKLPGPADDRLGDEGDFRGPSALFRDWQRTQTRSSATAFRTRGSKWMSGPAGISTRALKVPKSWSSLRDSLR